MKNIFLAALIICLSANVLFAQKTSLTTISGSGDNFKENDTVEISIAKYNLDVARPEITPVMHTVVHDHRFLFQINSIKRPTYINIKLPRSSDQPMLYNYLVSPGDQINLSLSEGELRINGNNSRAFKAQFELSKLESNTVYPHLRLDTMVRYLKIMDSNANRSMINLRKRQADFSKEEFDILLTDLRTSSIFAIYQDLNRHLPQNKADREKYIETFKKFAKTSTIVNASININADAIMFPDSYTERFMWDSCIVAGKEFQTKRLLQFMLKSFKGRQRDKAIVSVLYKTRSLNGNVGDELREAVSTSETPGLKSIIQKFISDKTDGSAAFDFSLTDMRGNHVKLSDFKGQVVVLDFWFTGCAACRQFAPYMKKIEEQFADKGVKFMSISIDKNLDNWKKSVTSGQYVAPNILNLVTNGNGDKDETISKYKVYSYPSFFVIDKNGKLFNIPVDPRKDNGKCFVDLISSKL